MGDRNTAARRGMPGTQPLLNAALRLGGKPLPLVGRARLYTCGITPYDVTHLGHAFDLRLVRLWPLRVLRAAGAEVTTCRNVTDVDDVLTEAAGAHGREPVSSRFTRSSSSTRT